MATSLFPTLFVCSAFSSRRARRMEMEEVTVMLVRIGTIYRTGGKARNCSVSPIQRRTEA